MAVPQQRYGALVPPTGLECGSGRVHCGTSARPTGALSREQGQGHDPVCA